jgi:hypothetical protein
MKIQFKGISQDTFTPLQPGNYNGVIEGVNNRLKEDGSGYINFKIKLENGRFVYKSLWLLNKDKELAKEYINLIKPLFESGVEDDDIITYLQNNDIFINELKDIKCRLKCWLSRYKPSVWVADPNGKVKRTYTKQGIQITETGDWVRDEATNDDEKERCFTFIGESVVKSIIGE